MVFCLLLLLVISEPGHIILDFDYHIDVLNTCSCVTYLFRFLSNICRYIYLRFWLSHINVDMDGTRGGSSKGHDRTRIPKILRFFTIEIFENIGRCPHKNLKILGCIRPWQHVKMMCGLNCCISEYVILIFTWSIMNGTSPSILSFQSKYLYVYVYNLSQKET